MMKSQGRRAGGKKITDTHVFNVRIGPISNFIHVFCVNCSCLFIFRHYKCFTILHIKYVQYYVTYMKMQGRRDIGISGSLMWSKILMELIFNPYGEFR